MTVTEVREDNFVSLKVEGRVDTNTAPELTNAIVGSFQKSPHLVIDFGACEYVSSAGLRALLIGQKTATSKQGSMKLINVPDVLMSVLKVSGFEKILTIE